MNSFLGFSGSLTSNLMLKLQYKCIIMGEKPFSREILLKNNNIWSNTQSNPNFWRNLPCSNGRGLSPLQNDITKSRPYGRYIGKKTWGTCKFWHLFQFFRCHALRKYLIPTQMVLIRNLEINTFLTMYHTCNFVSLFLTWFEGVFAQFSNLARRV